MNQTIKQYSSATEVIRPLGAIESKMWAFHKNLNGSTQGTQVIDFESSLTEKYFFRAIEKLYDSYVALQVSIKKVDGTLSFVRDVSFSKVKVEYIIFDSLNKRNEVISEYLDTPLTADENLWKVALLRKENTSNFSLVFSAHHAIIDANGMHDLADTLFDYIDQLLDGTDIIAKPVSSFPKPVDDLLHDIPTTNNADPGCITPHYTISDIQARTTGWQNTKISKERFICLNENLEKKGIKFNALISSAMCLASEKLKIMKSPFNYGTAVTLRFLQDSHSQYSNPLGCFMSIATNTVDTQNHDLISLAKRYDKDLMFKIMTSSLAKEKIDIEQIKDATKNLSLSENFSQGIGITNMGKVNITTHRKNIVIHDYSMLASRVAANFAFVTHCYELNGVLNISVVYAKPSLPDKLVKELLKTAIELINNFIEETNSLPEKLSA
jgi:hypothetical protein